MKKNKDEIVVRNVLSIFLSAFWGLFISVFGILLLYYDHKPIGLVILWVLAFIFFIRIFIFDSSVCTILTKEKIILKNSITKARYEEKWENFYSIYVRAVRHEYKQDNVYIICSYKPLDTVALMYFYQPYSDIAIDIGNQLRKRKKSNAPICIALNTMTEYEKLKQMIGDKAEIILVETTDLFGY